MGSTFRKDGKPIGFQQHVGTLKLILDLAVEAGARYDNPAVHIKRKKIRQKLLQLPSQEKFRNWLWPSEKPMADGASIVPTLWSF